MNRRPFLTVLSITTACQCARADPTFIDVRTVSNSARAFPWKPVRVIVPSAAGSPPDTIAREIAVVLAPLIGQPVIIVNRPGAGGAIGLQATANSDADGHTLVLATHAALTINPSLYEKLPYDPVKDFAPVTLAAIGRLLLVTSPEVPGRDISALVAFSRKQAGGFFYSSAGNGTPPHILADLFAHQTGIQVTHVPYAGGIASLAAVLTDETSFTFEAPLLALPHIRTGKLKAIATTGDRRLPALPDTPTFDELGINGMDAGWLAFLLPFATPREIVMRLNRDLIRALTSPTLTEKLLAQGMQVTTCSPEALARRIADDTPRWREAVRRAGIKPS